MAKNHDTITISKERLKTYIMISLIIIVLAVGIVWAKGTFFSQPPTAVTGLEGANLRVATLELPGMFCAGCAWSSESTLKRVQGVLSADISIADKRGIVVYNADIISKEKLLEPALIKTYDGRLVSDEEYSS